MSVLDITYKIYRVQRGDSLSKIARKYNVDYTHLIWVNAFRLSNNGKAGNPVIDVAIAKDESRDQSGLICGAQLMFVYFFKDGSSRNIFIKEGQPHGFTTCLNKAELVESSIKLNVKTIPRGMELLLPIQSKTKEKTNKIIARNNHPYYKLIDVERPLTEVTDLINKELGARSNITASEIFQLNRNELLAHQKLMAEEPEYPVLYTTQDQTIISRYIEDIEVYKDMLIRIPVKKDQFQSAYDIHDFIKGKNDQALLKVKENADHEESNPLPITLKSTLKLADGSDKIFTARRRFVYCWIEEPDGKVHGKMLFSDEKGHLRNVHHVFFTQKDVEIIHEAPPYWRSGPGGGAGRTRHQEVTYRVNGMINDFPKTSRDILDVKNIYKIPDKWRWVPDGQKQFIVTKMLSYYTGPVKDKTLAVPPDYFYITQGNTYSLQYAPADVIDGLEEWNAEIDKQGFIPEWGIEIAGSNSTREINLPMCFTEYISSLRQRTLILNDEVAQVAEIAKVHESNIANLVQLKNIAELLKEASLPKTYSANFIEDVIDYTKPVIALNPLGFPQIPSMLMAKDDPAKLEATKNLLKDVSTNIDKLIGAIQEEFATKAEDSQYQDIADSLEHTVDILTDTQYSKQLKSYLTSDRAVDEKTVTVNFGTKESPVYRTLNEHQQYFYFKSNKRSDGEFHEAQIISSTIMDAMLTIASSSNIKQVKLIQSSIIDSFVVKHIEPVIPNIDILYDRTVENCQLDVAVFIHDKVKKVLFNKADVSDFYNLLCGPLSHNATNNSSSAGTQIDSSSDSILMQLFNSPLGFSIDPDADLKNTVYSKIYDHLPNVWNQQSGPSSYFSKIIFAFLPLLLSRKYNSGKPKNRDLLKLIVSAFKSGIIDEALNKAADKHKVTLMKNPLKHKNMYYELKSNESKFADKKRSLETFQREYLDIEREIDSGRMTKKDGKPKLAGKLKKINEYKAIVNGRETLSKYINDAVDEVGDFLDESTKKNIVVDALNDIVDGESTSNLRSIEGGKLSRGFNFASSIFGLAVGFHGIYTFAQKKGEYTSADIVKLLESTSSGSIAMTGFNIIPEEFFVKVGGDTSTKLAPVLGRLGIASIVERSAFGIGIIITVAHSANDMIEFYKDGESEKMFLSGAIGTFGVVGSVAGLALGGHIPYLLSALGVPLLRWVAVAALLATFACIGITILIDYLKGKIEKIQSNAIAQLKSSWYLNGGYIFGLGSTAGGVSTLETRRYNHFYGDERYVLMNNQAVLLKEDYVFVQSYLTNHSGLWDNVRAIGNADFNFFMDIDKAVEVLTKAKYEPELILEFLEDKLNYDEAFLAEVKVKHPNAGSYKDVGEEKLKDTKLEYLKMKIELVKKAFVKDLNGKIGLLQNGNLRPEQMEQMMEDVLKGSLAGEYS